MLTELQVLEANAINEQMTIAYDEHNARNFRAWVTCFNREVSKFDHEHTADRTEFAQLASHTVVMDR